MFGQTPAPSHSGWWLKVLRWISVIFGQTRFFVRYCCCCCCFVNSLKTILGISSACVVYDERVLLMLLFSFRFYGVRSDIGVLGFFSLWFVSMLLSSDTDGRTAGTDVSDSLSILQERNNRSRATQGDQFNVRWCIFSVFFLIFNLRNQVFVFCSTLNGISRFKQCP